jgi:hypothetical protein
MIISIFICFLLNAKSSKTHFCEPARLYLKQKVVGERWWGTNETRGRKHEQEGHGLEATEFKS